MFRKTVIVALGFLGLFLAGTAAGTAPASAGYYACGPWNGWCGRAYWLSPGWGYGWYGYNWYGYHRHHNHNWGRSYGYWDHDGHQGKHGHHGNTHWKH